MKEFHWKEIFLLFLYFFIILFLELSFQVLTGHLFFQKSFLFLLFSSMCISCLFTLITSFFPRKIQKFFYFFLLFLLGLWFSIQFYVFKMFGFYFNFSLLSATGQVAEFAGDGVSLVFRNILGVFLFFFPFVVSLVFHKKLPTIQRNWIENTAYLLLGIFCFSTLIVR